MKLQRCFALTSGRITPESVARLTGIYNEFIQDIDIMDLSISDFDECRDRSS